MKHIYTLSACLSRYGKGGGGGGGGGAGGRGGGREVPEKVNYSTIPDKCKLLCFVMVIEC